ncbi:endonuclease [Bifidobacterium anseris]|uniref:UPF0102 protein CGZ88_0222 n=2 Tax=Bifidobacterium TaxID=1678 RepID=A0A2N5J1H0_9BIFI|nr:YraN family protein [Bifidobacterium anseris]PLS28060.1 endonuclease [Bifidobacterium anseris]
MEKTTMDETGTWTAGTGTGTAESDAWTVFEHDEDIWDAPAFGAAPATTPMTKTARGEAANFGTGDDLSSDDFLGGDLIGDEFADGDDEAAARLHACLARLAMPGMSARELGATGEETARAWLECRGVRVIGMNYRTRYGEIDVIAVTPNRTILFVEVKTRRTRRFGAPEEAVHPAKQVNLRRAAGQWLATRGAKVPHVAIRFDVIALSVSGDDVDVRHIPGAF